MRDEPLKLLVKLARRAGDINSAGDAAFTVFHTLHDARRLAALRAVGALRGIHDLLTVSCFCNFGHDGSFSLQILRRYP